MGLPWTICTGGETGPQKLHILEGMKGVTAN